ncbi:MAG: acetate--CoA ligase family protein, partial [Gammaproteobacteria bacterium]|nr:acetate--CoA ligase family protein [Gammaproteobacteria bacterium]
RDLADRGAGGAVCHAAGFGEIGGDGLVLQDALRAAAGDMALVGPNSNGLLNCADGLVLWPVRDHQPFRCHEGAAIISQSGGVAIRYVNSKRSVHVTHVISTGNQLLLDAADYIDVLCDDPRVRVIGLFAEGISDGPRFAAAVAKAHERRVPIVALKAGRTEMGARMALTHTASLASGDAFYQALFDRLGIIRVRSLAAFDETIKMVLHAGLLAGPRVAVLTASGAMRTMAADLLTEAGLDLPQPSVDATGVLREQMLDFAHVSNPLDYNPAYAGSEGLTLENEAALHACYAAMLSDPYDVAMMIHDLQGEDPDGELARVSVLRAWLRATSERGVPSAMVSIVPESFDERFREICIAGKAAPLQGLEDAVSAIAAAVRAGARHRQIEAAGGPESLLLPSVDDMAQAGEPLDEHDSRALLAGFGLPVNESRVGNAEEIPELADAVGYPVALKVADASIAHKARVGGVRLRLRGRREVEVALTDITANLMRQNLPSRRFLVERMVDDPIAELLLGITRDPRFGQALVIGEGGGRVETLRNTEMLLLPANHEVIRDAVGRLLKRMAVPEAALTSVADAASAVARFAEAHRQYLLELDVNPLLVTGDGRRALAVDAVIRLAQA